MWGFSEKEIEDFLTTQKGKRLPRIEVGNTRYDIRERQRRLIRPEKSRRSPWHPLFRELADLKDFLPIVEGQQQYPDIIAIRRFRRGKGPKKPRQGRAVTVIELKTEDAKEKDVAQLRRYMNLVSFWLENDIHDIRRQLGVKRGLQVRGALLAPYIPAHVWMSACSTTVSDIDLIAYETVSSDKCRKIRDIRFLDLGMHHAMALRKIGRKYRSDRRMTLDQVAPERPSGDGTESVPSARPQQEEGALETFPTEVGQDLFTSG